MAQLPGFTLQIADGNLNLQQGSNAQTAIVLGCSLGGVPGQLYAFGDQGTMLSTLVGGRGLELASLVLKVGGGPVYYMPLTQTTRGGVSTPVKIGTSTGTLAVSIAPQQSITATASTGGVLGTAAFTFAVGSGAPSAPITSASSWSSTGFQVPNTNTIITFPAGTYVSGGTPDVYTVSALGVISHPTGAGPAITTFASSPVDDYTPTIAVVTGGALGAMQFTYSLDGTAGNTSGVVTSAAGGVYSIPSTGLTLTFAGTFNVGDYWTFLSAAATFTGTDLTNAQTALQTTYLSQAQFAMMAVDGGNASAAAWATQASALESGALTMFNLGVYYRAFNACPTLGTVLPNAGAVTIDAADTDTAVINARGTISAPHVVPCAGDMLMTSAVTGLQLRRNDMWSAIARATRVAASQNLGAVADGGLNNVVSLVRDENSTPGFDAAGITTLRKYAGTGAAGFYVTDAHTGAASNSDYYPVANARVIDRASQIIRSVCLRYTLAKIPTTTKGTFVGVITEKKARQIEGEITAALQALVTGNPQDAVAASAIVTRTNNVLATSQLLITANVAPYAYARNVIVTLGMQIAP